jgi:hypothetical protein
MQSFFSIFFTVHCFLCSSFGAFCKGNRDKNGNMEKNMILTFYRFEKKQKKI